MQTRSNRESLILLLGDLVVFVVSLWLTLLVRYGVIPTAKLLSGHFQPFSYIFVVWIVIFFIFELYGRQKTAFRRKLFDVLLRAHLINSIIALIAFYFIPALGITPKVNFFIYSAISFLFVVLWRLYVV